MISGPHDRSSEAPLPGSVGSRIGICHLSVRCWSALKQSAAAGRYDSPALETILAAPAIIRSPRFVSQPCRKEFPARRRSSLQYRGIPCCAVKISCHLQRRTKVA